MTDLIVTLWREEGAAFLTTEAFPEVSLQSLCPECEIFQLGTGSWVSNLWVFLFSLQIFIAVLNVPLFWISKRIFHLTSDWRNNQLVQPFLFDSAFPLATIGSKSLTLLEVNHRVSLSDDFYFLQFHSHPYYTGWRWGQGTPHQSKRSA